MPNNAQTTAQLHSSHTVLTVTSRPAYRFLKRQVPNPILGAQKPEPDAEEAALGAHAVGRAGVRSGGGVFLPLHWRNHL